MAALVDERLRPPRQGDSYEGRVVLLDPPEHNRWPALLALGDALFGRLDWWPAVGPDAASALVSALVGEKPEVRGRPARRPDRFPDAGLTVLRTASGVAPEIWLRLDGGPHGFLSIAAHAHADALSVEVRHGGVDILADPGTYCYHGEPQWRQYFQSTIGHNTVELDGRWQSDRGGAFLWLRHARGRELSFTDDGTVASWTADHDGYQVLKPAAVHRRTVRLDREARSVEITDEVDASGAEGSDAGLRLAFHLGPAVQVALADGVAELTWPDGDEAGGAACTGRLELPAGLTWSLHRGETEPILGWYSSGLGHKIPAWTLLGTAGAARGHNLITRLNFVKTVNSTSDAVSSAPYDGGS
jgi:Heparinase II/III-like protein